MVEVIFTDEFRKWLYSNSEEVQDRLMVLIGILEQHGVTTPYPYSSRLFGTPYNFERIARGYKRQGLPYDLHF